MKSVFVRNGIMQCALFSSIVMILCGCAIRQSSNLQRDYSVIDTTIVGPDVEIQNANQYQNNANVEMLIVNKKLYYYIRLWPGSLGTRSEYTGKLCTIEDGEIYDHLTISAFYGKDDRFIYCRSKGWLVAYDTQLDKATKLVSLAEERVHTAILDTNGFLIGVVNGENGEYYQIKEGDIATASKAVAPYNIYEIGGKEFSIRKERVFCQDGDISNQFGPASFRAIVPYQNSLLLINDGYGNLLYIIRENGAISSVFPEFSCMCSTSSVNFNENYIFISFKRWESYDQSGVGLKGYENDDIEGTYRIDIRNNAIKKISERSYSGMYIFDNTYIYACTRDGDIYQLDFDGNVQQTIVD